MTTVKKYRPRVSREWLEQEYIGKLRDAVQIGAELGKDPSTIHGWLKHYGIPSRPRGANGGGAAHAWKKGEPSAFKGRHHTPESRELLRQACLADGRVPYLKDGKVWMAGRTGPANPHWKGGVTPERQEFYRSDEWKAACKAVWARANAQCECCGLEYRTVRKGGTKFHVHHIVSFAVRELRAVASNLVLCPDCHRFVHSRANIERKFLVPWPAARAANVPTLFDLLGEAS